MKFSNLEINDWKQFATLDIQFHDRLTVLTGANGSGKTTILHMLARCLGWNFQELATPKKDEKTGIIKFFSNWFRRRVEENRPPVIGTLSFSDGTKSELTVPTDAGSARYQIYFSNERIIPGINILSHRNIFKYQNVPTISTQKVSRQQAYNQVNQISMRDSLEENPYRQRSVNYHIKETLLSWAIGGAGNKYIEADAEAMAWYDGFERVLKIIMPKHIGFEELSIRNYEIVLSTKTGDFMLDAVSGGIAALIDLAWQIYNLASTEPELVVLIDEVENHLHATMQRSVLPDLLEAFPHVQFIISTHSPLIVASVKESSVYAFRYNEENRVYSEKLDLVNKARNANEILNEVLGVPFTMPIWAENALNKIVSKYATKEVSEEMVNAMRAEFKAEGLESLMPLAISKVLG
ncbi:MAG: AAA family ATPase [Bacteroidaceae bacterium]|nr:AAA family ATPase [Bacteroidaceae bacterium]